MASINTISLDSIGLQFLNPIGSGLAPQASDVNSFLSFLDDIKGDLATGLDTAFSDLPANVGLADVKPAKVSDGRTLDGSVGQASNNNENDPLNAALINALAPGAVATRDLPLPFKLSLDLFGLKSEAKGSRSSDKKESGKENISLSADSVSDNADPTRWMLTNATPMPLQVIMIAVDGGSGKASTPSGAAVASRELPAISGLPVDSAEEFTKPCNPRLNPESNPTGSTMESPLAFALRLNKIDKTTDEPSPIAASQGTACPTASANPVPTKTQVTMPAPEVLQNNTEPVRASKPLTVAAAPVLATSAQSGSGSGSNTDANSANHHSGNRESDPDSGVVTATPASAFGDGTPFHSTPLVSAHEGAAFSSAPVSAPQVQSTSHVPAVETAEPTTKTGAANQLFFSVSGNDQQKVEVRVTDRAGEVHVSVRTPDAELATTLRSDLGSLTGKLSQSGYIAEAFTPAAHGGELPHQQRNGSEAQADQRSNQGQGGGQGRNADRQQQQSEQNPRSKRPAWLDEFQNSLAKSPVSTLKSASGFKKG